MDGYKFSWETEDKDGLARSVRLYDKPSGAMDELSDPGEKI